VTEIKERILPELDEEFAKSVGDGYESIDALRQELEERVKTEAEQRVAQEYKESAVKALLDGATIELAPLMVEHEVEHMEDERERMLRSVNIRTDDYLQSIGKTAEEVRGEMGDAAVERLKRTFALTKVSELEETEVSDEEVDERIQTLLSETAQEQQVSDEMKDSVRRMLVADKTVDRLCAIARGEVPAAPKPAPEGVPTEEKDETDEAEEGDSGDDREA
jgi:trigger factor